MVYLTSFSNHRYKTKADPDCTTLTRWRDNTSPSFFGETMEITPIAKADLKYPKLLYKKKRTLSSESREQHVVLGVLVWSDFPSSCCPTLTPPQNLKLKRGWIPPHANYVGSTYTKGPFLAAYPLRDGWRNHMILVTTRSQRFFKFC